MDQIYDTSLSIVKKYDESLDKVDTELTRIYGERYQTYRKQYRAACEFKYEPDFPLYLMVEQTYSCNLKCPSCIHGFPDEKIKFDLSDKVMSRELFEKIVLEGEENKCPSIAFMVNDEPLIVPDLPDRVRYAKEHNFMDLLMTTNGTLLTPKNSIELIEAGITRILFSVDAATEATYEKVRPGLKGGFKRLWDNLNALVEIKKSRNLVLPAIRASFVESSLNSHEVDAFIDKFSGLVDYIEIQTFSSYYDTNKDLIPKKATKIEDYHCNSPWRHLIIRADGEVLPCCAFYGYEIPVGNIYESSLKDIFQGENHRQLRKDFKEGIYKLAACKECAKSFYKVS